MKQQTTLHVGTQKIVAATIELRSAWDVAAYDWKGAAEWKPWSPPEVTVIGTLTLADATVLPLVGSDLGRLQLVHSRNFLRTLWTAPIADGRTLQMVNTLRTRRPRREARRARKRKLRGRP